MIFRAGLLQFEGGGGTNKTKIAAFGRSSRPDLSPGLSVDAWLGVCTLVGYPSPVAGKMTFETSCVLYAAAVM